MKSTSAIFVLILFASSVAVAATTVVRGDLVYPVSGPPIEDGVVVIVDGKITAIGPADEVQRPSHAVKIDAPVVTPGLVDAHSVVGLTGYLNQKQDQEQLERSAPIQPELRAIDAYDAREPLITWLRELGVTTVHSGHGPGTVISGQTLIAKTFGDTVAETVIVEQAMIAATLGGRALSGEKGKSPGTRAKAMALLRVELLKATEAELKATKANKEEDEDDEPPKRDLRLEAMRQIIRREVPLLITAERHHDIEAALRIAAEFDIDVVLDGGAEAYLLVDEIRAAGVPVIIHPPMSRPFGERENMSWTTAAVLADAGILIAMQSGHESYVPKTRVIVFEAAVAAANGLGFDRALAAITLDAARVIGLGDRIGSLEVGKDGDLALWDGDPFEYTSHCLGVVIDGQVHDSIR